MAKEIRLEDLDQLIQAGKDAFRVVSDLIILAPPKTMTEAMLESIMTRFGEGVAEATILRRRMREDKDGNQ